MPNEFRTIFIHTQVFFGKYFQVIVNVIVTWFNCKIRYIYDVIIKLIDLFQVIQRYVFA